MKEGQAIAVALLIVVVGMAFNGNISADIAGPMLMATGLLSAVIYYGVTAFTNAREPNELTEWEGQND